jgi:hypothetical protein
MILPNELTNLILEFSGFHKLRNGRYMKQISEAQLFEMAIKIQRIPKIRNGHVKIFIPITTTTTRKERTTLILFNSSYDYNKSSRL